MISQFYYHGLPIRPIESHSRAQGNILVGPLWGEYFFILFLFKIADSGALYIFE